MNDHQPYEQPQQLLTVQQVADRLAVSCRTVYRLVAAGVLMKRSIGGSTRFLIKDVTQLVDRAESEDEGRGGEAARSTPAEADSEPESMNRDSRYARSAARQWAARLDPRYEPLGGTQESKDYVRRSVRDAWNALPSRVQDAVGWKGWLRLVWEEMIAQAPHDA